MWIADKWKDYELIDCGSGEKLERWGTRILVRPEPTAIWQTPRRNRSWQQYDARFIRSGNRCGSWEGSAVSERWQIRYRDMTFQIKPMSQKQTGLFPEQAVNWDFAQSMIRRAGREINVLNLFAYTGGATIACAAAGAKVCHVDSAKGMVTWGKENARASGLENAQIRWIVDDCTKFVGREIRRGHRYDAIIMDPPSYGRGPSGEVWKMEEDLYPFVKLTTELLSDRPLFVLINSYTTGLAPSVLSYILDTLVTPKFGGHSESSELGLKVKESGLPLPCGSAGRWICDL